MKQLLLLLGLSVAINGAMFVVAYRRQTDALTDISYACSFVALVVLGLLLYPVQPAKLLLAGMVTLWAARLGGYLLVRIRRMGRDKRFDAMRHNWVQFGRFWLSQAVAVWVILLPTLLVLQQQVAALDAAMLCGVALWAIGLVVEAVADQQKFSFANNPANKGKWIASGLWHYSRHPNYFGEILVWVGMYATALPSLLGWQLLVGLGSPLFIISLLLFVSGIPPLEKGADARWGSDPKYRAYKARTSVLVPWLPRSETK